MGIQFDKQFWGTYSSKVYCTRRKLKRSDLNFIVEKAAGKKSKIVDRGFRRGLTLPKKSKYSFAIFCRKSPVNFLANSDLKETHYGYILIIESGNYLFTFSRRARSFTESISEFALPIEQDILINGSLRSNSDIRRVRSSAFSAGTAGCRTRQYEGVGLQASLGSLANSRSLLKAVAGKRNGRLTALTLSESKITEYRPKSGLGEIAEWVGEMINEFLKTNKDKSAFVSSFAQSCKAEEAGDPVSILFHTWELEELINERLSSAAFGYHLKKSTVLSVPEKRADKILQGINTLLEFPYELVADGTNQWKIVGDLDGAARELGKILRKDGLFKIESTRLSKYFLREDGDIDRLPEIVTRSHAFSLSFKSPEFFHSSNITVRDSGITLSAELVLNAMESHVDLDQNKIDSEKGDRTENDMFGDKSIFKFIDDQFRIPQSFLVCDDEGTEWADFISFQGTNTPNIQFIHAKHKNNYSAGASPLHEVVSQALKNLGELHRTADYYKERNAKRWSTVHPKLNCKRFRYLNGFETIDSCIDQICLSSKSIRTVTIVVNFLSRSEFEKSIKKLDGSSPHLIQRVWLLSAFISTCKEVGVVPQILCSP